ncbi:MAG: YgfZ/GcvT domain-containing protein [Halocynthiibacter sp.]
MTKYFQPARRVIRVTGSERITFLQGLVTNTIATEGLIYSALLTPQGKYLADFFVKSLPDSLLIDVAEDLAARLTQRLTMYRLRADVHFEDADLSVLTGYGDAPADADMDPRHAALGWRAYGDATGLAPAPDQTALRVEHLIPETGIELTPDTYILEVGFERLNGVDFKKGCFIGQEIVARMKYKTELRKGLARVTVEGDAEPGAEITLNGKPVGTLHSRAGNQAIAYLRFDRAKDGMVAGAATVTLVN